MAGEKACLAALIGGPVSGLVSGLVNGLVSELVNGLGRHDAALWQLFAKRQKFNQIPPVTVTVY
jgi:hypothetical protein